MYCASYQKMAFQSMTEVTGKLPESEENSKFHWFNVISSRLEAIFVDEITNYYFFLFLEG